MKKLSILFLTLALVGVGCSQKAEVVEEVSMEDDNIEIMEAEFHQAIMAPEFSEAVLDSLQEGEYSVDSNSSKVAWAAMKVTKQGHNGEIAISDGSVVVTDGSIVSGSVTMDIDSINSLDTEIEKSSGLIQHLKSEDFLYVEVHPTATFTFTSLERDGNDDATITGMLTMRGIEKEVSIPVVIEPRDSSIHMTGSLEIDRTDWEINAQSGKFFASLGDATINDEVVLSFDATWTK